MYGGVAQLVRATACHAVGRRFESGRPRIKEKLRPCDGAFLLGLSDENREGGRGNGSFTVGGEQDVRPLRTEAFSE